MRYLLTILLLCIVGAANSQYNGMDSIRIASRGYDALVRKPSDYNSNSRKYPVVIFMHGNGEAGTNLSTLFNQGLPRTLTFSSNQSQAIIDSVIFVMPQMNSNAGNMQRPEEMLPLLDYIDANYRVDTTRFLLTGLSQGGANALNLIVWDDQYFGVYHGKFNRFKKIAFASTPIMNWNTGIYSRMAGRRFRAYIGSGDAGFLSQHRDNVARMDTISAGGQYFEIAGGGHNAATWDSVYSLRGVDTTTNMVRWLLNASAGSGGSGGGVNNSDSSGFVRVGLGYCGTNYSHTVQVYWDGTLQNGTVIWADSSQSTLLNPSGFVDYTFRYTSGTGSPTYRFYLNPSSQVSGLEICGAGSGGGSGSSSAGFAPAPTAWGKKIKPVVMMDFERFDQFLGGGGGMKNLFDDSTNTNWYPFRNPTNWIKTGWDAFHKIQWHGNRGLRMLWDLVGDTNILDLSKTYIIRDTVYFYEKLYNSGKAALYLAVVDSVIANVPWHQRHHYFARPDSLLKPFAKLVPLSGAGQGGVWRKAALLRPAQGRYVLAWGVADTTGATMTEYPDMGELSFYGTPNFDSANIKGWTDYPVPKQNRDIAKFAGFNMGGLYKTDAMKYRHGLRMYSWPFYMWDQDSTAATGSNYYRADPYNSPYDWSIIDSLRELGTKPYLAVAGGNYRHRMQSGSSVGGDLNKMPPTEHMAEIEDFNSYVRSADFFKHFGAKFGRNTKGLTAGQLRWAENTASTSGLGRHFFDYVEDGNEEQHRTGLTELGYFLRASMDYDGHAGYYPNTGLKGSDDSMKLIMSATAAPDTNRTKMYVYFAHFFRPDSLFFFDAINQHHYASTLHKQYGYVPGVEAFVGQTGATPEYDSVKYRFEQMIKSAYRYVRRPLNMDWTEFGYDNFQQPVPDPYVFLWTHLSTPDYPAYDSMQDKAITIEANIMEAYAAGLNNITEFMSENPCFCPNNNPSLFATAGEIAEWQGYSPTKYYLHWYTKNWHARMLSGWAWDSEIRGDAGDPVRIYKLRKINSPDSVCYYVRYWPLDDVGQNVTLNVGSVTGNGLKKYLNFADTPPTESAAIVSSGEVQAVAQARAQYYFFQETTAPIPPTIQQQIRFSNRLKFTQ